MLLAMEIGFRSGRRKQARATEAITQANAVLVAMLGLLAQGTFFGELTLLAPGHRRNARVRAATDMRCLAIPRDTALAVIESRPSARRTRK